MSLNAKKKLGEQNLLMGAFFFLYLKNGSKGCKATGASVSKGAIIMKKECLEFIMLSKIKL